MVVFETNKKKAISFTPASWDLFGVRMKKHYSYNAINGKMYRKEPNPVWYWCEFTHGENATNCEPWQNVLGKHTDPWSAVGGAMEWLEWDEMEEEEKKSIFIKLWRSDHVLIGIFDAEEIEEISCGNYEPWEEL